MMIPRETDLNKQEEFSSSDFAKNLKLPPSSTSTASWSRLKDPRIVRVSKAYGGKDRHSKVCTIRGLRDRRVRLSVPTAIQLYDLQDRLGLNQPSKVVDWLLNAAKHEIDELPPLDIPPGSFQAMAEKHRLKVGGSSTDQLEQPKLGFLGGKLSREVSAETSGDGDETNWGRNGDEGRFDLEMSENSLSSRQNLSGLLNSSSIPYNSFSRSWDPSNLTLSHPPRSNGLTEDWQHNFGFSPMSAAAASGSHHHHHHHQVLVYQPGLSTQSYFHPQNSEMNFQTSQLSTSSPPAESTSVRPIHFSTTANLLRSQNNNDNGDEQNKSSM